MNNWQFQARWENAKDAAASAGKQATLADFRELARAFHLRVEDIDADDGLRVGRLDYLAGYMDGRLHSARKAARSAYDLAGAIDRLDADRLHGPHSLLDALGIETALREKGWTPDKDGYWHKPDRP